MRVSHDLPAHAGERAARWLRLPACLLALGVATPAGAGDVAADPAERYNEAIAALREGADARAEAALDALARDSADDELKLAWRDRANLMLGYHRLRRGDGAAAAAAFDRVRSPGPDANGALLGRGWACLVATAPTGDPQVEPGLAAADDDARAAARRRAPFRYGLALATGARAEDLRRALIPWSELTGRDPLDPAVQEAMLAVPYALVHLGAARQAEQHLERATTTLEQVLRALDQARADVDGGALLERLAAGQPALRIAVDGTPLRWWRADLASPPPGFYLDRLMEADDFRQALAAWRDRAEPGAVAQLRAVATRELAQRLVQTRAYLAEAHFAMARLDDPAAERKP